VIQPTHRWWESYIAGNNYVAQGNPVGTGFRYSSDSNSMELKKDELSRLAEIDD
jgi:hypothetical protein